VERHQSCKNHPIEPSNAAVGWLHSQLHSQLRSAKHSQQFLRRTGKAGGAPGACAFGVYAEITRQAKSAAASSAHRQREYDLSSRQEKVSSFERGLVYKVPGQPATCSSARHLFDGTAQCNEKDIVLFPHFADQA